MRATLFALAMLTLLSGCSLIPDITHQPVVHNPFPQLTTIAIAPFFNLSTEPSVDGRQFALAYFNELQLVPGFEVLPVGVVEKTIENYKLSMSSADDARKLAQILGADAVVVGAVTDFSPFYPPRCGLQVEWYAANPCFHPIPPGYGLPWGTPEEEYIPAPLALESEMALARAQLRTQTPPYQPQPIEPPLEMPRDENSRPLETRSGEGELLSHHSRADGKTGKLASSVVPACSRGCCPTAASGLSGGLVGAGGAMGAGGVRGGGGTGVCQPSSEPVLKHTKTYNGHDGQFTAALASYAFFQDDARFGGWQSYLQRSDDFIRFCSRMHIYEMLSARGGADETRVVWRWSHNR